MRERNIKQNRNKCRRTCGIYRMISRDMFISNLFQTYNFTPKKELEQIIRRECLNIKNKEVLPAVSKNLCLLERQFAFRKSGFFFQLLNHFFLVWLDCPSLLTNSDLLHVLGLLTKGS